MALPLDALIQCQLAITPALQHSLNQFGVVFKVPVKTSSSHAQGISQHQDPHAIKPMVHHGFKGGVQPVVTT